MVPDEHDLRSASFTIELLDVMESSERVAALAQTFAVHRRVCREQVLVAIESCARDQRAKAAELRRVSDQDEHYHQGMAAGMDAVLVAIRRTIRELRAA